MVGYVDVYREVRTSGLGTVMEYDPLTHNNIYNAIECSYLHDRGGEVFEDHGDATLQQAVEQALASHEVADRLQGCIT